MRAWGELWLQYGDTLPEHVRIHPDAVAKFFEHVSREEAIRLLELHIEALKDDLAHLQALVEQGYEWPEHDMRDVLADLRRAERIIAQLKRYSVQEQKQVVKA